MFGKKIMLYCRFSLKNSCFEFGFRSVEESNFRAYVYNK